MEEILEVPKALEAFEQNQPPRPIPSLPVKPENSITERNKESESDEQDACIGHLPIDIEESHRVSHAHEDRCNSDSRRPLHTASSLNASLS
jgi:hypothetical protein